MDTLFAIATTLVLVSSIYAFGPWIVGCIERFIIRR